MEKDIDRIGKNPDTDIVIRIDDFGGKRGLTIREFVKSERYTGFTKAGTRIPADKFKMFKEAINSIDEKDLDAAIGEQAAPSKTSGQKTSKKTGQKEQVEKDGDNIIDEIEEKEM
ncbi:hypothetical protein J4402_02690 [Candidatus Pacearchaeota archaeon]|nr:hypothetical protein [Candidatus Pacearchaeota archaeon]